MLSGTDREVPGPDAKPDDKCDKCTDDRKDKPMLGMEIIRDIKASADDKDVWEGGNDSRPEQRQGLHALRLTPVEGGKKLEMRGYIGPFYRTQVWLRVE